MPFTLTQDERVAASALASGSLAALPTETVYGLGAHADSSTAVSRIFEVKQRPRGHPLIVHVQSSDAARYWVDHIPSYTERLMQAFWPGPLTLVLHTSGRAPDAVTGGHDTIALRVPRQPVMQQVLRCLADLTADSTVGIAAPSANLFGRVSPTTVDHVVADIGAVLRDGDVILDGGPCRIGVESTIVDCTDEFPRMLRPGSVAWSSIETAGDVALGNASDVNAPGNLPTHYAPRAKVVLRNELNVEHSELTGSVGLIALADVQTPDGMVRLLEPSTIQEYAHDLYGALREADARNVESIVAILPTGDGLAEAIRDRLEKAARSSAERL